MAAAEAPSCDGLPRTRCESITKPVTARRLLAPSRLALP